MGSHPRTGDSALWGERVLCQTAPMICMTILYPKADDSTFDMEYYTSTHMPMVAKAFGDACQG